MKHLLQLAPILICILFINLSSSAQQIFPTGNICHHAKVAFKITGFDDSPPSSILWTSNGVGNLATDPDKIFVEYQAPDSGGGIYDITCLVDGVTYNVTGNVDGAYTAYTSNEADAVCSREDVELNTKWGDAVWFSTSESNQYVPANMTTFTDVVHDFNINISDDKYNVIYYITPFLTNKMCLDDTYIHTIGVHPEPNIITHPPSALNYCNPPNNPPDISIFADNISNPNSNVNWQELSSGNWGNASGTSNGFTFTPEEGSEGSYRAVLKKKTPGHSACRDTTTITVLTRNDAPTVTVTPDVITRCFNDTNGEFTATVNPNINVDFQWQEEVSPNTYVDIVGATGNTYNPGNTAGTYQVVITDNNMCSNISNSVEAIINELPPAGIHTNGNGNSFCEGDSLTLLAIPVEDYYSYEWYYSSNPSSLGSDASIKLNSDDYEPGNYYVRVTNTTTNCQNDSPLFDVQIYDAPEVEMMLGADSLCVGEILSLEGLNTGNSQEWSGPNGFISNSLNTQITVGSNSEGSYQFKGSNTYGCADSVSMEFLVKDTLQVTIQSPSTGLCEGTPFSLMATVNPVGSYSYQWSQPDGTIVGYDATLNLTADYSLHNGIFQVIVNDNNLHRCPDTTSVEVLVKQTPTAEITIVGLDNEFCSNENVAMSVTSTNGATYSWSGPNLNFSTPTINFDADGNAGSYSVTVTKEGCPASADTTIIVHQLPNVSANVDDATPCVGQDIEFEGQPTNLSSYSWTYPSMQFFSSDQSPMLTVLSEADHEGTYTLTGTDSNGCSNTGIVTVDVIPAPILNTPSDLTICSGETVNFDLTDLGGNSISYTWQAIESSYIAGETTIPQNSSVINDELVNNSTTLYPIVYSITGVSTQQCASIPVQFNVYVQAAPTLVADFNPNGVEGSECGLVNHNITGVVASNIETTTISWSSSAAGSFAGQSINPIFQPASSLSTPISVDLTITANGVGACSEAQVTDTYELDYFVAPAIAILEDPNERVCENTSFEFDNVTAVGGSLQWTTSGSGTFNNPTLENPTYTPSSADADNGSVILTGKVTGSMGPCNGEMATSTYNLIVDQVPNVVANPANVSICEGDNTILNASITNADPSTIVWNTSSAGELTGENTLNPTYTSGNNEGGTDVPVIITVHGEQSCSSSTDNASVTVSVKNNPEIIINDDFDCADDRMTFSLTGSAIYADNISISPIGNVTLNSNGTFSINGIPTNSSFIITATNNDGCELMTTLDAHTCPCDASFTPEPPNLNTETLLSCLNSPIQTFIINNAGGNLIGEWLDANGNIITIGEAYTPDIFEAGEYSYNVRLRNTSSDCPSDLVSLTYTILELPVIQTEDKTICSNENLQLTASTSSTSDVTWLWSGGAGQISNPAAQNPVVTGLTQSTSFTVQLTDEFGCVSTEQVDVTVNAVPSATIELAEPDVNSYCQGDANRPNIIFTFSGGAPYSFKYKKDNMIISVPSTEINGNQYILENATFGTYQLVSVFNGCSGNIATNVVTIIENTIQPVSISGSDKVCEGDQIVLTSNPANYENYIWSGGNASGNNSSIEISNPGTYILQVVDANGCTSSSTHNVTLSKTIAEIIPTDATTTEICAGGDLNLTATNDGTLDLPYTFSWSPISDTIGIVNLTPSETSNFMVTITNSYGCEDSDTITVTVNNPVEPDISINDKTLCQSDTFEFNVTNYSSFNNIIWGTTGSNSGPNFKLDASLNVNQTELVINSTDKKGCTAERIIDDLVVYQLPSADPLEDNFTVQVNESEILELENVSIDSKCAGSVIVNWYRDGVLVQSNSSYTYLFEAESADLGQSIVYTARIQDNCSCESSEVEFFINVVESEDCKIDFVNENVNKGCVGSTYTFNVKGSSEKFNFNEAFWAISKDKIDTTQIDENNLSTTTWEIDSYNSVSNQDGIAESTFIVHFSEPGVYRVFYTVIFGDCTTTRSRKIEVFDLPEFNIVDVEFPDPFCYDEEVVGQLKLNLEDGPLYKLNYALNGVTADYIFNAGNNTFELGKQDPGILSIEFRSLSAEIDDDLTCTNYLNPFPIVEVEILNQFEINKVSECKGDSIQYTIILNYGKKPYSLNLFNYSSNEYKSFTIEDPLYVSDYYPTSQIIELGAHSNCNEEEIKLTLDDKCLECVPDFNLIFDNSNIDTLSNNLLVCTNAPYLIPLRRIEYDTAKYRMLAVIQKSDFGLTYNENNIEYVLDTFDTKNFEITLDYAVLKEYLTVSADVKYNIVLYPLPRFTENSSEIKSTPCDGKAIKFGFTYPPISEILYAQDTICQNQASVLLEASGQGDTDWILDENYEGEVYYVGDNLYLDFSEQNPSDGFDFVLKKDVGACIDHDTLTIHISEDENKVAPEVKDIYGYPGGIFIYEEDGLCYRWGVEGITGTIPDSLINKKYFFFSDLSNEVFNSVTHRVYVDVRYPEGDLCNECVNRIYYNLLTPPKFNIDPNSPYNWSIYPNPAHDILVIDIAGFKNTKFEGSLYAITGQLIETNLIDKNSLEFQYKWDISNLANGIYILKITDEYGNIKIEKIIKN